jgi:hypothetical protein
MLVGVMKKLLEYIMPFVCAGEHFIGTNGIIRQILYDVVENISNLWKM